LKKIKEYGIAFADYLIESYCFRINNEGAIYIDYYSDDLKPELKAQSMNEFFEIMKADPDKALM